VTPETKKGRPGVKRKKRATSELEESDQVQVYRRGNKKRKKEPDQILESLKPRKPTKNSIGRNAEGGGGGYQAATGKIERQKTRGKRTPSKEQKSGTSDVGNLRVQPTKKPCAEQKLQRSLNTERN